VTFIVTRHPQIEAGGGHHGARPVLSRWLQYLVSVALVLLVPGGLVIALTAYWIRSRYRRAHASRVIAKSDAPLDLAALIQGPPAPCESCP
jgi:hypothetical protein